MGIEEFSLILTLIIIFYILLRLTIFQFLETIFKVKNYRLHSILSVIFFLITVSCGSLIFLAIYVVLVLKIDIIVI